MNGQMIVQWLTPLIMFTLAIALVVGGKFDPRRRLISLFPLSYLVTGLAFTTEILLGADNSYWQGRALGDQLYVLAGLLLAAGFYERRNMRPPWIVFCLLAIASGAANVTFWVNDIVWWRVFSTSVGISLLLLSAIPSLRPARRGVDKVLLVLVPSLGVAITAVALFSAPDGNVVFNETPFIAFLNLIVSGFSLAIALSLIFDVFSARAHFFERQALTDSLTKLLNRRGFETEGRAAVARSQARGEPVAFIVVDIDHFKPVNDEHGHPAGDVVLRDFAQLLRDSLGDSEILGRIGGEEFAIIVPNCSEAVASLAANDLRQRVAAMNLDEVAPGLRITATFGVVEITTDFDAAFVEADAMLLCGKRQGRNRVETVQALETVAA